ACSRRPSARKLVPFCSWASASWCMASVGCWVMWETPSVSQLWRPRCTVVRRGRARQRRPILCLTITLLSLVLLPEAPGSAGAPGAGKRERHGVSVVSCLSLLTATSLALYRFQGPVYV